MADADFAEHDHASIEDFIRSIRDSTRDGRPGYYLWDWSLAEQCPRLLDMFRFPSYVSGDLLQRYRLMPRWWPSLLIGSPGSRTGLHMDTFQTHFYLILLEGKKDVTVYTPRDTAPLYYNAFLETFPWDGLNQTLSLFPDADSRFPLLRYASPTTITMVPGDLLIVPAGSPHTVVNHREPTLAVAGNFVDDNNWAGFVAQLREKAQSFHLSESSAKQKDPYHRAIEEALEKIEQQKLQPPDPWTEHTAVTWHEMQSATTAGAAAKPSLDEL